MFSQHRAWTIATTLLILLAVTACAPVMPGETAQPTNDTAVADPTPVGEEEVSSEASEDVPAGEEGDSEAVGTVDSTALTTFELDPVRTTVRFELDEDLRGNRITVVGVSDQVAGQLEIDPANLASASIGPITIDAASFVTDADRRNQAIRRFVLKSAEFETITFTPTSIAGLPESAAAGDSAEFQIEGDLTIRDITQPLVFDAAVSAATETEIAGSASTVVTLETFGLNIPSVPMVANVEDELELYIDFVATAQ